MGDRRIKIILRKELMIETEKEAGNVGLCRI
jgi:hypothetical protein